VQGRVSAPARSGVFAGSHRPPCRERNQMKKVMPPVYLYSAILLAIALHLLLPLNQLLPGIWRLIGLVALMTGIVLNLAADQAFKKRGTTVKPYERSTALVTDGVFRISRNPMYLGMSLMVLGIALLLGSAAAIAMSFVFPVLLDRIYIVGEEQMLEEAFGGSFRAYRKRVRRWV